MRKQNINIGSFQKNISDIMELVMNGDEIVITKENIPIAKISPIENKSSSKINNTFLSASVIEAKRKFTNEAPENWFG